jgi:serine/threonine protein kinase
MATGEAKRDIRGPRGSHSQLSKRLVSERLDRWEEAYEQGRDIPVEELCADCPELAADVAEGISLLKESWLQAGGGERSGEESSRTGCRPGLAGFDDLKPGVEPLPGYRLLERIGGGGFGEVWSVEWFFRQYALKLIRDEKKLLIECEGLALINGLSHQHLLHRLFFTRTKAGFVVIMEVADETLEGHFAGLRGRLPVTSLCAEAVYLLRDAAEALDYLHTEGEVVHLDVKPANLFLRHNRCKVGDFGTVRAIPGGLSENDAVVFSPPVGNGSHATTECYRTIREVPREALYERGATLFTHAGCFSPRYAPPEAFDKKASRTSDQYSLALTFCELVTGTIPFQGKPEEQEQERAQGITDLRVLTPLPEPLWLAVDRALSPRPEDRFPSCMAFVEALRDALLPLVKQNKAALARLSESPVPHRAPASSRKWFVRGSGHAAWNHVTWAGVLAILLAGVFVFSAWGGRMVVRPSRGLWWLSAGRGWMTALMVTFLLMTSLVVLPSVLLTVWVGRLDPLSSIGRVTGASSNEGDALTHPEAIPPATPPPAGPEAGHLMHK